MASVRSKRLVAATKGLSPSKTQKTKRGSTERRVQARTLKSQRKTFNTSGKPIGKMALQRRIRLELARSAQKKMF